MNAPTDAWLVCNSNLPMLPDLGFDKALQLLSAATIAAARLSFQYSMWDVPEPGTMRLVYADPNAARMPMDGIRYNSEREQVQRVSLPFAPNDELAKIIGPQADLELLAIGQGYQPPKHLEYGQHQPSPDQRLARYRKRYRLLRSPWPQLQLIYWGIESNVAACPPVPPGWDREIIRSYPLPVTPKGHLLPFQGKRPHAIPPQGLVPPPMPAQNVAVPIMTQAPGQPRPVPLRQQSQSRIQPQPQAQIQAQAQPQVQSLPPAPTLRTQPAVASATHNRPKAKPQPPAAYHQRLAPSMSGPEEYEQISDALDAPSRSLIAQRYQHHHQVIAPIFDAWSVRGLLEAYVADGRKGEGDASRPQSVEDEKAHLQARLDTLKAEIAEMKRTHQLRKS